MNEKAKPKRTVRRYSLEEKLRLLDEADKPGESIGTVSRRAEVSASVMFKWRQARESGAPTGLKAEEELVPMPEMKAARAKIRALQGLLGKKTEEIEILKDGLEYQHEKKGYGDCRGPLPMRNGRAVRHTHDYKRHGVVDLFAAIEVATGKVTHETRDSHTSADFLSLVKKVAKRYPGQELHVILDNSSTRSTPEVCDWLRKNRHISFHYTPTNASWLNRVEGFFGILGKQSLSMTHFPSKRALRDHIAA